MALCQEKNIHENSNLMETAVVY